MKPLVTALCLLAAILAGGADGLAPLVHALGESSDPQVQVDILRGLRDALQGRASLSMPSGWAPVEARLLQSGNPEIRGLARGIGLTFGSQVALAASRSAVRDRGLDPATRQEALRALVGIRDAGLPETLRDLLSDNALRDAAIRALAAFDDPGTAPALLGLFASLTGTERRDALNTLAARAASARQLLNAVETGTVPNRDLTADLIRQLRNLKDETVNASLAKVYGTVREVATDKQAEIDRYKRLYYAGGSTPGDAIRGRAVFAKVCQQCHTLFDVGGKVGPDLTGSNRGDLDYLLQNILDPNAVIPNEYVASTVDMKDGRVLTGIIKQQDDKVLSILTANETISLPRADIDAIARSQLSMMPEGLIASLADQEYRDLIYYLGRPGQAPMLATADTVNLFFNGRDLTLWQGDESRWRVENGEIVGRSPSSPFTALYLRSDLIVADFRLIVSTSIKPESSLGAVCFRAEPTSQGEVRGYEAGIGARHWGNVAGVNGPAEGAKDAPDSAGKPGDWNLVEILATGSRLRTAINGKSILDVNDPSGARQGIIALAMKSTGGSSEIRFKDLQLELNPKPELSTIHP